MLQLPQVDRVLECAAEPSRLLLLDEATASLDPDKGD